jgi:2-oxoglutarate ferredoxin oxidoreductase subunit delta
MATVANPDKCRNAMATSVETQRNGLGSLVITVERCKGCGFCIEFCPTKALEFSEQYNGKGYHPPVLASQELCNGCNICGLMCPDFAIYGFASRKKRR